jgi:inner membrane protein
VEAALQQADPASRVLDVAMTAFPAQPLCWSFVAIEENVGQGSYRIRRGLLNLAPGVLAQCPAAFADPAARNTASAGVSFASEWQGSLATLRTLARSDCHVNAWLRFARMPAVDAAVASDLRFSATPRGNFTTMDIAQAGRTPCGNVPHWAYPRADLLGPALK